VTPFFSPSAGCKLVAQVRARVGTAVANSIRQECGMGSAFLDVRLASQLFFLAAPPRSSGILRLCVGWAGKM